MAYSFEGAASNASLANEIGRINVSVALHAPIGVHITTGHIQTPPFVLVI